MVLEPRSAGSLVGSDRNWDGDYYWHFDLLGCCAETGDRNLIVDSLLMVIWRVGLDEAHCHCRLDQRLDWDSVCMDY